MPSFPTSSGSSQVQIRSCELQVQSCINRSNKKHMSVRLAAFERLGRLRNGTSQNSTSTDRLKSYYERQLSRNTDGRLSQRCVEAFIGLCASCEATTTSVSTEYILENLQQITSRWKLPKGQNNGAVYQFDDRLGHLCRAAFEALLTMTPQKTGLSEPILTYVFELIENIKSQPYRKLSGELCPQRTDDVEGSQKLTGAALLANFLHAVSDDPTVLTYSQFARLTTSLTDLLLYIHNESSKSIEQSFDALAEALDASKNQLLQVQEQAAQFVLRWTEETASTSFGVPASQLWVTFADKEKLESDNIVIDQLIWSTIMENVQAQHKLTIGLDLSTNSDIVKAYYLRTYCISSIFQHVKDGTILLWIREDLIDTADGGGGNLGIAVIQILHALAVRVPSLQTDASALLQEIIVHASRSDRLDDDSLVATASRSLLKLLESSSQDNLIATIMDLANHLSGTSQTSRETLGADGYNTMQNGESTSNLSKIDFGDRTALNAIDAIAVLGKGCHDAKVSVFALNVLLQKAERASHEIKCSIIIALALITANRTEKDIFRVSNFYQKLEETTDEPTIHTSIQDARNLIARRLAASVTPSWQLYLETLLKANMPRARLPQGHRNMDNILVPLATMFEGRLLSDDAISFETSQLFHNFWFRLVLAGYLVGTPKVATHLTVLKCIARASPSLALETYTDSFESDLESYPILKQAHEHEETKHLQAALVKYAPTTRSKADHYSEAVYMNALALLENLKSQAGIADGSLAYYRQATIVDSDVGGLLSALSFENTKHFLSSVRTGDRNVQLDRQLANLLIGCCDPVKAVRTQSSLLIDQIVASIPSAFCSNLAITTLLECVTLLGWACYEEYSDQYSPNYEFRSSRIDLTIVVSDSFRDRQDNLRTAQALARKWLDRAMLESASDVRTLLSTYITLTEDHTGGQPSDMGKHLAIEMAMRSSARDQPEDSTNIRDSSDAFLGELTLRHLQSANGSTMPPSDSDASGIPGSLSKRSSLYTRSQGKKYIPFSTLRETLCVYVSRILESKVGLCELLKYVVEIPFNIFNIAAMRLATSLWARIITEKPHLQASLFAEIARCWNKTLVQGRGMFSKAVNNDHPFSRVMEYAPTDKDALAKEAKTAKTLFEPHLNILRFLSSRMAIPQSCSPEAAKILLRLLRQTLRAMIADKISNHTFCRELRLRVVLLTFRLKSILAYLRMIRGREVLSELMYDAALSLFATSPRWAFGSDSRQMRVDRQLIVLLLEGMRSDPVPVKSHLSAKTHLLALLLEQEVSRIDLWLHPMTNSKAPPINTSQIEAYLAAAWKSDPNVAISLAQRLSSPSLHAAIRKLILQRPWQCLHNQHAVEMILGTSLASDARQAFRYLLYWTPVVPISASTYFLPSFKSHPLVLQYAMRSLESHPVEVTFFYVPQIVQVLRHDTLGYVRRFIVETAKLSQLFAHQIIWNFDANAFKDEDATLPDTIKPTLDSIKASMMRNLSGADKLFYETEFRFFGEVTSISGKLKPFIKKTKPEKKAKIDEEMALIKVEQGVYLPSNPDGVVIDIDRRSGRPLQSHAKAPFMATFMIQKSKPLEAAFEDDLQVEDNNERESRKQKVETYEKRQSAIFKVGDDCRQDVLALQLISTFRSVFNSIGLDLYVFPYRVTATAPGCGVIDVLPNSVSRDMLGREAVNGLYDYFITTFGKPETVAFQKARMNFVKSLAAYSVISYLLQFKDRHNGNIMYDNQGHILHIDFGFCFDIAPGGITFESAPFKLTTEMVAVMGGSVDTQSYKMFQELCIKAFLVARQYSEQIIHLVTLMLDSGLPCFKGQTTITNLRNRFHLNMSEQQASQVMLTLISQAHLNQRTVAYDVFQKMTNGIPY